MNSHELSIFGFSGLFMFMDFLKHECSTIVIILNNNNIIICNGFGFGITGFTLSIIHNFVSIIRCSCR